MAFGKNRLSHKRSHHRQIEFFNQFSKFVHQAKPLDLDSGANDRLLAGIKMGDDFGHRLLQSLVRNIGALPPRLWWRRDQWCECEVAGYFDEARSRQSFDRVEDFV